MSVYQSILLGIIQGLTEFIPISSSGHLVILPFLFQWEIPQADAFLFNVLVQVATLLAVFIYFWKDLVSIAKAFILGIWRKQAFKDPQSVLGWYLILASIPAGLVGLVLKGAVENAFASVEFTALFLFVTAGLLLLSEKAGKRNRCLETLTWQEVLWIGFFQVLAIFPGVSRSGSTITAGMLRNLDRPAAARFSFLMSIPIMLAAGLMACLELAQVPNVGEVLPSFIPGFVSATIVGYLSIRWLLHFLANRPMHLFAIYCTLLGLLILGLKLFGF